ncbi:peroxisome assembly protein 12-like isoform X2 [Cherax quadricarinatus]|uniref:peroxisome assembly protein 12-like isoform X2 n=1 Tax=Cherax quadricarinatus TaxID=27406 RepID=UPI00387EB844
MCTILRWTCLVTPAALVYQAVVAESNPEKYEWCLKYSSEIFAAFNLILQHHYLSNYGGSFAENFYDLKRIQLKGERHLKPLSISHEAYIKSLLTLVAFPYLWSHLDNVYQDVKEKEADNRLSEEVGSLSRCEKRRMLIILSEEVGSLSGSARGC